jgi:hypothetical protein
MAGTDKDVCVTEAKAAKAEVRREGADERRDADYAVTKATSDVLAGEARTPAFATPHSTSSSLGKRGGGGGAFPEPPAPRFPPAP